MNNCLQGGTLFWQEYDFEIKYINGKDNIIADALTRFEEERRWTISNKN